MSPIKKRPCGFRPPTPIILTAKQKNRFPHVRVTVQPKVYANKMVFKKDKFFLNTIFIISCHLFYKCRDNLLNSLIICRLSNCDAQPVISQSGTQ